MKIVRFLLLFASSVFAQTPLDTIPKKITAADLFSDYDIAFIDSLLMDTKYKSPLYDNSKYIIQDIDKKEVSDVVLSTEVLKERLQKINTKTPFHIAYNPSLEKVIKSYLKYRKKILSCTNGKGSLLFSNV
jgi:membrane-bound lytic murein transglycosylase D